MDLYRNARPRPRIACTNTGTKGGSILEALLVASSGPGSGNVQKTIGKLSLKSVRNLGNLTIKACLKPREKSNVAFYVGKTTTCCIDIPCSIITREPVSGKLSAFSAELLIWTRH